MQVVIYSTVNSKFSVPESIIRKFMIPKPGKDHGKTKGWRPINLINCIGKLGDKVVADRLQESGLLH